MTHFEQRRNRELTSRLTPTAPLESFGGLAREGKPERTCGTAKAMEHGERSGATRIEVGNDGELTDKPAPNDRQSRACSQGVDRIQRAKGAGNGRQRKPARSSNRIMGRGCVRAYGLQTADGPNDPRWSAPTKGKTEVGASRPTARPSETSEGDDLRVVAFFVVREVHLLLSRRELCGKRGEKRVDSCGPTLQELGS